MIAGIQNDTVLYHGTRHRTLIESIDLDKTWRSAFATGFYAASTLEGASIYSNWRNPACKDGGFIYTMTPCDNKEWLNGDAAVDDGLLSRLESSMRALGKDPVSGHDFAQEADKLKSRVLSYGRVSTQQLVAVLQAQFGTPYSGKPDAKTALNIFQGIGVAGIFLPELDTIIIFDPSGVSVPKPYTFYAPENPAANTVAALYDILNKSPALDPVKDQALRLNIAKVIIAIEQKSSSADEKMRLVRHGIETSGIEMTPEIERGLKAAETVAAAPPPVQSRFLEAPKSGPKMNITTR